MTEQKHIIWSDDSLDEYIESALDEFPEADEATRRELAAATHRGDLEDARYALDITLPQPILVIGDLGLWNGRRMAYKEIQSGKIGDCLYSECDYNTWFVDKNGDLCCDAVHHDGTNHYMYRTYKNGVSEAQIDRLKEKLYCGTATRNDITRITRRLGDDIAKVYGFSIPRQRQAIDLER